MANRGGSGKVLKEVGVKFSIDAKDVDKNVKAINKNLKLTSGELDALKKSLKLEWNNEKFNRAMELAREKVKLTGDRVHELNRSMAQMNEKGVDKTSEEFRKLATKIAYAEEAAQKAAKELKEIEKIKLDHLKEQFDKVQQKLDGFAKTVMPASVAVAAGFAFATKAAVDMDTAMVGVKKTTDLTADVSSPVIKCRKVAIKKCMFLAVRDDI